MKYIGAHLSTGKGISTLPGLAYSMGFSGFALFVKSPKTYTGPAIPPPEIAKFQRECMTYGFSPDMILPHAAYLLNLANPDPLKMQLSRDLLLEETKRCESLGLSMLNLHPGSDVAGLGEDKACWLVSSGINYVLERTQGVSLILECTAGKGKELGGKLEHLAKIIDGVEDKGRVGVCIDTCHAYDAGYDLRDSYDQFWDDFYSVVGSKYLRGIHLNDSKYGLGSRKDRHADIGEGTLGAEFFERVIKDPRLENIPIILETPSPEKWEDTVRELRKISTV